MLKPKHPNGEESAPSSSLNAASGTGYAIESQPTEERNSVPEWDQDDALQTGSFLLPGEFNLTPSSHDQIYEFGNPRLPIPILSSASFFPSIDYKLPNVSPGSDSLYSSVPHEVGGEATLSSSMVQPAQNEPYNTSQSNEQRMNILPPGGADINYSRQESETTKIPTITSLHTSRSSFTSYTSALDCPTTWNKTIPPTAFNISIEDVLVTGVQVLLFNGSSPTSIQDPPMSATTTSPRLPSPYANTLQINRTRTLSACLRNALSIGLLPSDVTKPFCIGPSLFYRPHSPSDDPVALLAAASKPGIPIHLQPTLPQVLYQHPAFLDLIPLPGFRTKIILAGANRGWGAMGLERFDVFELKKDMFQDGLAWGGKDSCGRRDAQGQPWDMRSWEAAEWFVKKWRGLLDDIV